MNHNLNLLANFEGETFNSVVESDAPFGSLSVECWEVFIFVVKNWLVFFFETIPKCSMYGVFT